MKKLILICIIFLIIGGFLIKSQNKLDLNDKEDKQTFIKDFTIWVLQIGKNVFELTGHVSRLSWLPNNESINQTNSSVD